MKKGSLGRWWLMKGRSRRSRTSSRHALPIYFYVPLGTRVYLYMSIHGMRTCGHLGGWIGGEQRQYRRYGKPEFGCALGSRMRPLTLVSGLVVDEGPLAALKNKLEAPPPYIPLCAPEFPYIPLYTSSSRHALHPTPSTLSPELGSRVYGLGFRV